MLDRAWNSLTPISLVNEPMEWCKAAGTLPLMGLNLGTGTAKQAAALVVYCNVEQGTKWSDLRRTHGYAEPYNVKHWCFGVRWMDHGRSGTRANAEYGMKAQDSARQMR